MGIGCIQQFLCQYKDIFGKPNTGVHTIRIYNIAIVDVLATVLLAYVLKTCTDFFKDFGLITLSLILVLASVYIHRLFCVETTLVKFFNGIKLVKVEKKI